jgi:hypothetical protein
MAPLLKWASESVSSYECFLNEKGKEEEAVLDETQIHVKDNEK